MLILGSMPGEESLRRRQYYAHPQNQFWRILGELLGAARELEYMRRLEILQQQRIALWDVARICVRAASSDATIRAAVANDISGLLAREPAIGAVLCNGTKAHELFVRLVAAALPRPVRVERLPSTSPANASMPYARKLALWRRAIASPS